MNPLNGYAIYNSADEILKFIDGRKGKKLPRWALKKNEVNKLTIQLLLVHGLIQIVTERKKEMLILTEKGIQHLAAGGFGFQDLNKDIAATKKSFKVHLDDITGLLTIFGILNAVILFASQVKQPIVIGSVNLNASGVQFVSISMYLLSILVLVEIIWITLNETQNSFKFQILYYLLCTATIGIGMLFLSEFYPVLYMAIGMIVFFGISWAIFWILLHLLSFVMTRRNAHLFSRNSKAISLGFIFISLVAAAMIARYILLLLTKK